MFLSISAAAASSSSFAAGSGGVQASDLSLAITSVFMLLLLLWLAWVSFSMYQLWQERKLSGFDLLYRIISACILLLLIGYFILPS